MPIEVFYRHSFVHGKEMEGGLSLSRKKVQKKSVGRMGSSPGGYKTGRREDWRDRQRAIQQSLVLETALGFEPKSTTNEKPTNSARYQQIRPSTPSSARPADSPSLTSIDLNRRLQILTPTSRPSTPSTTIKLERPRTPAMSQPNEQPTFTSSPYSSPTTSTPFTFSSPHPFPAPTSAPHYPSPAPSGAPSSPSSATTPTSSHPRPRLTEDEKKANHIASEQKRRQAIREGFDRLTELVPGIEGMGRSEALVLMRTVEYLRELMVEESELRGWLEASGLTGLVEGQQMMQGVQYGGMGHGYAPGMVKSEERWDGSYQQGYQGYPQGGWDGRGGY